ADISAHSVDPCGSGGVIDFFREPSCSSVELWIEIVLSQLGQDCLCSRDRNQVAAVRPGVQSIATGSKPVHKRTTACQQRDRKTIPEGFTESSKIGYDTSQFLAPAECMPEPCQHFIE